MKRGLLLTIAAIILLVSVCSFAQQDKQETFQASGIVLTYSPDVLRVQERIDVGILRLYSFKITADTKIYGIIREGGWVSVVYTQRRLGRRLLTTAVEIKGFAR
jgi:hypothetical protein